MANPSLFRSLLSSLFPPAAAVNASGAPAYARSPEQALAQLAATGCFNSTFYAAETEQLARVLGLATRVSPQFLAQVALVARTRGHMKDMPALLLVVLSRRDPALMARVFDRVVDSPRVLRTFVQMVRSGVTGRRSLGSAPRRCVRQWLEASSDEAVFAASVGNGPSLADVVRMVHPRPSTPEREALLGYLVGRQVPRTRLPRVVQAFEAFRTGDVADVPDVPFQMLTALDLDREAWAAIARRASWQTTRMNLNTFARHGVFAVPGLADVVAARLRDPASVASARAFPYQLLAALRATDEQVPRPVRAALEAAMELALANVPVVDGQVYVCPDVSGSMRSPITGRRAGATTAVRCVDVAALIAAAIARKNPTAVVMPFDTSVVSIDLSPAEPVIANADRLAAIGGGGTSVSAPLWALNRTRARGDLVVIVSDNESWVDEPQGRGTETMRAWQVFKARNPGARLVLIDLQPSATTQAWERDDVLNVGGFSDHVFTLMADFAAGRMSAGHWVDTIRAVVV